MNFKLERGYIIMSKVAQNNVECLIMNSELNNKEIMK